MGNNFLCTDDMNLKLGKKLSRKFLGKVKKFQSHSCYRKKVIKKKPIGGAQCAPPPQ